MAYYVNFLPEIKCWKAATSANVFQILSQSLHTIWWQNYLFITSEMLSEEGKVGELGEEERVRKSQVRAAAREKKKKGNEMETKVMSKPQIKKSTAEN